jgi:enoyl-CoA hydratase/carnithine racemase
MADIRLAAEDAIFALPEAQVGVSVDAGGDLRLARDAGAGWAKLLALTGRRIDAATAERIGVVQSVVPRDRLDETAHQLAREIRDNAPLAVQSIKRTINAFADRGLTDALRFEAMSASMEFVSEDMPKGYAAKAAKQVAEFEGK